MPAAYDAFLDATALAHVLATFARVRHRMEVRLDAGGPTFDASYPARIIPLTLRLYRSYFRVQGRTAAHIPADRCLPIANHSRQMPFDGAMTAMAAFHWPNARNTPANYLRLRVAPTVLGFDPILQLLREDDPLRMAEAAVAAGRHGVFNLAGIPPLPLSRILRELGKPTVPVPYALFCAFLACAWSPCPPKLNPLRFNAVVDTHCAEAEIAVTPEVRLPQMPELFRASTKILRYL